MHSKIPDQVLKWVSVLYRFVLGAFGVSRPHPYATNFCPVFWITVVGLSVGLLLVLLGWTIRLIFGKGQAQKLGKALSPLAKFGKIAGTVLFCGAALAFVGSVFYRLFLSYGWWGPVILILGAFGLIGLIVVMKAGVKASSPWLGKKYEGWKYRRELARPEERKPNQAVKVSILILKVLVWPLKTLIKIIWGIFHLLGVMLYAFYKRFCPYEVLP